MNTKRNQTNRLPSARTPAPAAATPWPTLTIPRLEPPPAVDPARFLDAAQAAFEAGDAYRSPHAETLLFLAERLGEPTSTGLPDPFAPALRVLTQTLYGPSGTLWDEAEEAFRRRYLASGGGSSPRGADAAVRRWQALADLGPEAGAIWP